MDPLRVVTKNLLAINIKFISQALSLIISKIRDAVIDLTTSTKTVKEL